MTARLLLRIIWVLLRHSTAWLFQLVWDIFNPVVRRLYVTVIPEEVRSRMPEEECGHALLFCALVSAICGGRLIFSIILTLFLVMFLAPRRPSRGSFELFFEKWFAQAYFPNILERIRWEFREKAWRELSLFGRMRNFCMSVTLDTIDPSINMSVAVWYQFWAKHCLPGTLHVDLFVLRLAYVNLGTKAKPCRVTFAGFFGIWFRFPVVIDYTNVSLVRQHCCE